ncbi:cation transporter [Candidatus Amarolinea dominans]|uniref:cation transporter n=1 Tax=Candidatus Amarolinea dominans TaxID=3140696 RepID=UPI0031CC80B8
MWGFIQTVFHMHGHGDGGGELVSDSVLTTSREGIRALQWSLVSLLLTAVMQVVIVAISGSVALLADTIHNFADATTAVPLWLAFALNRRQPSRGFTYRYGKAEDPGRRVCGAGDLQQCAGHLLRNVAEADPP